MEKQTNNKMGSTPVFKLLMQMAIPMIISMLIQSLYNVVDSIFVGKYAYDALTAIGLAWPMQNLIIAFATGIGVGINATLSKSLGEKNYKKVTSSAVNGCFIMFIIYLLFLLSGLTLIPLYFKSISNNQAVINYGITYLKYIMIGSFGVLFSITFERLLQSTGKTGLVMISQASGTIINIILDPILIFGFGFIKSMGIHGAAIATLIGQFCSCFIGLILNIKYNKEIKIVKKDIKIDLIMIKEILLIGIPSSFMAAIASVLTFLFNRILLKFYNVINPITNTPYLDLPQTVFGLYFKLNSLFFMPVFGLNNALVPIVAYNYGAKEKVRLLKTFKYSLIIAIIMMTFGTLMFMIFPSQLLAIFAENKDVANQLSTVGNYCLRIISISFIFAGVCIVITSMFQALGNGVYSLICSFVRQLIVLLPCAYLLSLTNNLSLVWLSFLIAELVALLLSIILFKKVFRVKINLLSNEG